MTYTLIPQTFDPSSIPPLKVGPLTAYAFQETIFYNDKPLHLPPKERSLLKHLMQHANVIVTDEGLMRALGIDPTNVTRTHRRYVERLRKKLEAVGLKGWLITVPEVGVILRVYDK